MRRPTAHFLALLIALVVESVSAAPAFPTATGFGAHATGGRGGAVLIVTTLADSGVGSLQWALDQPGPRIIVFAVSGVIVGDVRIPHGDVTVAGQSAPGAGITISGHLTTDFGSTFGNIILRHLRVRPPDPDAEWPPSQHDAIQFSGNHTILLDHVSASHGADETIDFWGGTSDVTIQWSSVTYPIYEPATGWDHNKGMINHRPCLDTDDCTGGDPQGGHVSINHNLFAHSRNRTPALSIGPAEVIGNVIYNGREGFVHHNIVDGDFLIEGNNYIGGPSASLAPFWFDPENVSTPIPTRYWLFDNLIDDPGIFVGRVDDPWLNAAFGSAYSFACCGLTASQFNQIGRFDFSVGDPDYVPTAAVSPAASHEAVLRLAGAFPRDVVDGWAVDDVRSRGGAWGNRRPADLLEGLVPTAPPTDLDLDGMADSWEPLWGLDPTDGNDHSRILSTGETAIERYLEVLAQQLIDASVFADGFETGNLSRWTP